MPEQATVPNTVISYQYGSDLSFIGAYPVLMVGGQDRPHLPPMSTLVPPPTGLPRGKEAAYDAATDSWQVRDEDLSWMDEASRAAYLAQLASEEQVDSV